MGNFEAEFKQPPEEKEKKTDIPESEEALDYRQVNAEKSQEEQDLQKEQKEQKDKEVITNPAEVREKMRQFWYRELDSENLNKELEEKEKQHLEELLRAGYEMEASRIVGRKESEESISLPENQNQFLFASHNEVKQEIVAKAAENQGMVLREEQSPPSEEEEKLEHQILKQLIREEKEGKRYPHLRIPTIRKFDPVFYAIDIAEAKALKMAESNKDQAMIASDIVVLRGKQVLGKPKGKDEALKMLNGLSGKEVRVSLGMSALTPTSFGKTVLFKEGAYLTIKLSNFSESRAKEYSDRIGEESYLNTAGVLDYANPLSRNLISDKPIKLEILEFGKKIEEPPKAIFISPDVLPQLKDYFMGVPNELTEEMLRRIKSSLR